MEVTPCCLGHVLLDRSKSSSAYSRRRELCHSVKNRRCESHWGPSLESTHHKRFSPWACTYFFQLNVWSFLSVTSFFLCVTLLYSYFFVFFSSLSMTNIIGVEYLHFLHITVFAHLSSTFNLQNKVLYSANVLQQIILSSFETEGGSN